ncbi:polyketide synthase [Mycobacterium marinum]|nr:polyketide synthase [Mycobacterium marinum]
MPVSTWKSRSYYELMELLERIEDITDEYPYFQSLSHGNIAKYEGSNGPVLNFACYDYLGLSADPRVKEGAAAAVQRYGCSAGASRLVAGEFDIHSALENALAELLGQEKALAFVSGYNTNVSTLGFLLSEEDVIICDHWVHNSIAVGVKLARARSLHFPHNDVGALASLLEQHKDHPGRVAVCIEGLYSMDGDLPPLAEIAELKEKYGFLLFVDEAHAIGTVGKTGRGITEHFGLPPQVVDIQMGTLSKTFGSCGGYIAGSADLIMYLKYNCPGFVFSTGLPGPLAAAALRAVELLRDRPELVSELQMKSESFRRALGQDTPNQTTPIVPVIADFNRVYAFYDELMRNGIRVFPITYPAVSKDATRLRFFINVNHSVSDLVATAGLVRETINRP